MKKIVALLLALVLVLSLASCGAKKAENRVAMVTDYSDITDRAYNQTTWEACLAFSAQSGIEVDYYRPATDDTAGRVAAVKQAIAEGHNVIVLPGGVFGATIAEVSRKYPDVKFIALDVTEDDLLEAGVALKGENYDGNPDNWNLTDYVYMDNVYCAVYQEALAGYMAGYAAVKLGYTKLGFLGSVAVPAVIRFGYGFLQGADAAARELGISLEMKYAYANQSHGGADVIAVLDTWYGTGTEVVFACGGSIYTSVAEAARKVGGKVIGMGTDQSDVIDSAYGAGLTLTSAMKGLYPTTVDTLTDICVKGNWDDYAGKIQTLGLVSGTDPEANYVQLTMSATQFADGKFTVADYEALVKAMFEGAITVSDEIVNQPAITNTNVSWLGNLK